MDVEGEAKKDKQHDWKLPLRYKDANEELANQNTKRKYEQDLLTAAAAEATSQASSSAQPECGGKVDGGGSGLDLQTKGFPVKIQWFLKV